MWGQDAVHGAASDCGSERRGGRQVAHPKGETPPREGGEAQGESETEAHPREADAAAGWEEPRHQQQQPTRYVDILMYASHLSIFTRVRIQFILEFRISCKLTSLWNNKLYCQSL